MTKEHIQRISADLLNGLHKLAKHDKITGWSEQATPTLCELIGLTTESINKIFIGSPFSYNGRISKLDWIRIQKENTNVKMGKLYHALKW